MSEKLVGNALIGQSGGPTMVINQSLVGIVEEALKYTQIRNIYGARHGVRGILDEDFIDLKAVEPLELERVANTPSAALGSVRHKVTPADCDKMFNIFRKHNVRYFFYIGGNDSAETAHIINVMAEHANYEFHIFHVPKTIDNDLLVTDHCPGYGSAAKFVAQALMGENLDNRALQGIKVNVIMGRHAGFLTGASALGRKYEDDGPHLIYFPERPFNLERFIVDVDRIYSKLGRCLIAVSEGITDKDHVPIAQQFFNETDAHGNVQLSGSGALGDFLTYEIRAKLGANLRVRADTFGYLQRSFLGVISDIDAREARLVGRAAVDYASQGNLDGSIALKRIGEGADYASECFLTPLSSVAKNTKSMPHEFINEDGNHVTEAFHNYAGPLLGRLPEIGRLY